MLSIVHIHYSPLGKKKEKKPTNDVISGTPQFYTKSIERRRKYMN
jgi:hypothetical protein